MVHLHNKAEIKQIHAAGRPDTRPSPGARHGPRTEPPPDRAPPRPNAVHGTYRPQRRAAGRRRRAGAGAAARGTAARPSSWGCGGRGGAGNKDTDESDFLRFPAAAASSRLTARSARADGRWGAPAALLLPRGGPSAWLRGAGEDAGRRRPAPGKASRRRPPRERAYFPRSFTISKKQPGWEGNISRREATAVTRGSPSRRPAPRAAGAEPAAARRRAPPSSRAQGRDWLHSVRGGYGRPPAHPPAASRLRSPAPAATPPPAALTEVGRGAAGARPLLGGPGARPRSAEVLPLRRRTALLLLFLLLRAPRAASAPARPASLSFERGRARPCPRGGERLGPSAPPAPSPTPGWPARGGPAPPPSRALRRPRAAEPAAARAPSRPSTLTAAPRARHKGDSLQPPARGAARHPSRPAPAAPLTIEAGLREGKEGHRREEGRRCARGPLGAPPCWDGGEAGEGLRLYVRLEPHVFPLTNARGSAQSLATSPAAVPAELQQRGGTRVRCAPLTPDKTIICRLN